MSTTPQNDSVGTSTSNGTSNGSSDEPKVIIDPAVLADGAQTTDKVEKTESMPAQPDAATATGTDGSAAAPAAGSSPADPAATLPAANASKDDEDEEPKLPTNDGRTLKYGLAAAAIVGAIGLFVIAYAFVRNNAPTATPTVVVPSAPAGVTAPVAPGAVVPEVRTPAPRRIDATGCTRGQYVIEGNELVFRNCALLELADPASR